MWHFDGEQFKNSATGETFTPKTITSHYMVPKYLSSPASMRLSTADSTMRKQEDIATVAERMAETANKKADHLDELLHKNHKEMFANAGVNGVLNANLGATKRELINSFGEDSKYVEAVRDMTKFNERQASLGGEEVNRQTACASSISLVGSMAGYTRPARSMNTGPG